MAHTDGPSAGAEPAIERLLDLAVYAPVGVFVTLRDEFFATYEAALCVHSRLFEGMEAVLGAIEARGARWGIVTNKMMRFTDPLVAALGLRERAACVVSGDTTPHAKPHPAPLLHALTACEVAARANVFTTHTPVPAGNETFPVDLVEAQHLDAVGDLVGRACLAARRRGWRRQLGPGDLDAGNLGKRDGCLRQGRQRHRLRHQDRE